MKIRIGFVSNSSSASYIIKINEDLNTFIDDIYAEFYHNYFDVKVILEHMKDGLSNYNSYIEKRKNNDKKSFEFVDNKIDNYTDKINFLEHIIDLKLNKSNNNEGQFVVDKHKAIKWILENIYDVNLEELKDNWIKLDTFITMHNSYDDVPSILRSIITYYNFEKNSVKMLFEKDD